MTNKIELNNVEIDEIFGEVEEVQENVNEVAVIQPKKKNTEKKELVKLESPVKSESKDKFYITLIIENGRPSIVFSGFNQIAFKFTNEYKTPENRKFLGYSKEEKCFRIFNKKIKSAHIEGLKSYISEVSKEYEVLVDDEFNQFINNFNELSPKSVSESDIKNTSKHSKNEVFALSAEKVLLEETKKGKDMSKIVEKGNSGTSEHLLASKIFEEYVYINKNDHSNHLLNPVSCVYERVNIERMAEKVSNYLEGTAFEYLISNSTNISIAKLIFQRTAGFDRKIYFTREYTAVKVLDENTKKVFWVHLKLQYDEVTKKKVFIAYKPAKEHFCYYTLDTILTSSQMFSFVEDDKKNIQKISFDINKFNDKELIYTYIPRDLRDDKFSKRLVNYFLKTATYNEDMLQHLMHHMGAFLYPGRFQKSPIFIDKGRTGKSQLVSTIAAMFGDAYSSYDISSNYTFSDEKLLGVNFLVSNEVKDGQGKVNQTKAKEITGGDNIAIERKNMSGLKSVSMEDVFFWMITNKIFVATDQGSSMVERFDFIVFKQNPHGRVIENISKKLLTGYDLSFVDKKGRRESYRSHTGDTDLLFEFMMLGALRIDETNGACLMKDIPLTNKIINKEFFKQMIKTKGFIEDIDYEITKEEGNDYMSVNDIYSIYYQHQLASNVERKFIPGISVVSDIINNMNAKEKQDAIEQNRKPNLIVKKRKTFIDPETRKSSKKTCYNIHIDGFINLDIVLLSDIEKDVSDKVKDDENKERSDEVKKEISAIEKERLRREAVARKITEEFV